MRTIPQQPTAFATQGSELDDLSRKPASITSAIRLAVIRSNLRRKAVEEVKEPKKKEE